ncbi:DUF2752 domain-containing protein [Marinifilum sp. RC60d5]|uniref:DUF2752 domain-containing protein n=1 Tax=Marinifilum sp. RC60d5 TaxID=3458414 RepID=UPI0040362246
MWQQFIKWLENVQIPCSFQKYFGIECPGCGFQSALIALLKGNIYESIQLYPALLPILSFIILLLLHVKFRFSWGSVTLKILSLISFLLIIGNYFYKIVL